LDIEPMMPPNQTLEPTPVDRFSFAEIHHNHPPYGEAGFCRHAGRIGSRQAKELKNFCVLA
jgi:hypothetical protein